MNERFRETPVFLACTQAVENAVPLGVTDLENIFTDISLTLKNGSSMSTFLYVDDRLLSALSYTWRNNDEICHFES